jgi:hypothetical protein
MVTKTELCLLGSTQDPRYQETEAVHRITTSGGTWKALTLAFSALNPRRLTKWFIKKQVCFACAWLDARRRETLWHYINRTCERFSLLSEAILGKALCWLEVNFHDCSFRENKSKPEKGSWRKVSMKQLKEMIISDRRSQQLCEPGWEKLKVLWATQRQNSCDCNLQSHSPHACVDKGDVLFICSHWAWAYQDPTVIRIRTLNCPWCS